MREWLMRLHDWLRRDRLDRELAEELRFHHAQLEHQALAQGIDPGEAGYIARRKLGNMTRHQEAARERWSWPWLDHLQKDLRYALRGLRRSPGFTATVILTFALGIGANALMFGVIDRLIFRPLPYLRDPDRVHRVYLQSTNRDGTDILSGGYEYTTFLDLQRHASSFSAWAAWANFTTAVGQGDASRELRVGMVSGSFFDFFDARPALGRFFGPAEDLLPEGAPVVVLSYPLWQSDFGGRDVRGEILPIGNVPATIIGVAPKGFTGIPDRVPPAAFIPITTYAASTGGPDDRRTYYTAYHWGWVSVYARRKPDVSIEAASADLSQAYVRSWNSARAIDPELTLAEIARPAAIAGPVKTGAGPTASLEAQTVRWVTGVAVIVLLIASANVANLLLARMLRRRREIALRLALGVSRRRLLAQALVESLLLSGAGLLVGLAIAQWGGAALRRLLVDESPLAVVADPRTLALAAAAALAAAMLSGLGPALLGTRTDLAGSLKAGAREGTWQRSRTRSALLVVQGALSAVLLIGAGLFVQSLRHVRDLRMGYDAEPVVMISRHLRGTELSERERVALGGRMLDAARSIPGVIHPAVVSSVPFWSTSSRDLFVAGIDSVARLGRFNFQTATPDYFAVMDTRILRGRAFTEADRRGAPPVAVVSQAMAEVLWPGQEALGQCFRINADTVPCTTVIGIAENAVQRSLQDERPYRYYMPLDQYETHRANYMLLRIRGEPAREAERIRQALQAVMPGQAYVTARPLNEIIDGQRRSWTLGATMFVAFGVLALLVAAVGLYGVISYGVAQRAHELGVRIALGAQSFHVVHLVVGQGARFALTGVALGTVLALLAARWIQPLLFQQSARDPAVYAVVAGLLFLVAVLASAVPARRATRADPITALRAD